MNLFLQMSKAPRPIAEVVPWRRPTRPNNHESTENNLRSRQVWFKDVGSLHTPDLAGCISRFNTICNYSESKSGSKDFKQMLDALNAAYEDEDDFDRNLFSSLADSLGLEIATCDTDGEDDQATQAIVLNETWDSAGFQYAVGFARQVKSKADLKIPESFGCARSSRQDHSCVLLRRPQRKKALPRRRASKVQNWKVVQVFATVELLTQTTACRVLFSEFSVQQPGLGQMGALGQTLAYVLSDVWTCIARTGASFSKELATVPSDIPFAIIACKLRPTKRARVTRFLKRVFRRPIATEGPLAIEEVHSQWALGRVLIPRACGDRFTYSVDGAGEFNSEEVTEATLGAYLTVMNFGLKMGKSLKDKEFTADAAFVRDFHSMTGQKLIFGDTHFSTFKCEIAPFAGVEFNEKISQGEIWVGSVDLQRIREASEQTNLAFLFLSDSEEENQENAGAEEKQEETADYSEQQEENKGTPLLMKVSSTAVYNWFSSPVFAKDAWKASVSVKNALNNVLVAAEVCKGGLCTIMFDLRDEFSDLFPADMITDKGILFSTLWTAFTQLVTTTLIPLASVDVLQPDLRAGFDYTANILVNEGGTEMRMIDFETLSSIENIPQSYSDVYISSMDLGTFEFLWWQCFSIAEMWLNRRIQKYGARHVQSSWKGRVEMCCQGCVSVKACCVQTLMGSLDAHFTAYDEREDSPELFGRPFFEVPEPL